MSTITPSQSSTGCPITGTAALTQPPPPPVSAHPCAESGRAALAKNVTNTTRALELQDSSPRKKLNSENALKNSRSSPQFLPTMLSQPTVFHMVSVRSPLPSLKKANGILALQMSTQVSNRPGRRI